MHWFRSWIGKLVAVLCAATVALAVLGIAPKAAYAEGETYTLSFTYDGQTEVFSTDYKLGTIIEIDDDGKFDDIVNAFDEDYNWPQGITEVIDNGGGNISVSGYSSLLGEWDELAVNGPCSGKIKVRVTWSPIYDHPIKTWYLDIQVDCTLNQTQLLFDANGGDGRMEKQYVPKNVPTKIKPNEFTWDDHKFLGWTWEKDGSGGFWENEGEITISSPSVIYAKWAAKHSVTVNDDGHGTGSADPTGGYEGDTIQLSTTPNTGYKFDIWDWNDPNVNIFNNEFTMPDNDVTVKATFVPNDYDVMFFTSEGTGSMSNQSIKYDEEKPLNSCGFTYEGYAFDHWVEPESGATYTDGQTVKNLTDIDGAMVTLRAVWTAIGYNLTVSNDGNGTASADKTNPLHIGDKVSLEATPNTGYVFDEWEVVSGGVTIADDNTFTMPASDVTIKAKFRPISYTVAFDANGGDGQMDDVSLSYEEESKVPECTFTRTGYKLTGWSGSNGTDYQPGDTIKNLTDVDGSTITMSAQWTPVAYTVAFDANGGEGKMANQPFTYDEEQALTTCAFTRKHFNFTGWKGSDSNDYSDGQRVKNLTATDGGTVTMTAQWERVKYTVSFDANGGSGRMDPQVMESGVATALSSNHFARDGYTFVCWNTKADGSGDKVADGAKLKVDSDMTLYAQWKKDPAKKDEPTTKTEPKVTPKKNPTLPKTGDLTPVAATVATAFAGAASLVVGLRKKRR